MRRFILMAAVGLAWMALGTSATFGQSVFPYGTPNYGPYYKPQLSPYLNLARPGNPATNYFLGTLPEFDRRSNERSVQSSLQYLENRPDQRVEGDDLLAPLAGTGHATAFGNFGTYFGQGPRLNTLGPAGAFTPGARRR